MEECECYGVNPENYGFRGGKKEIQENVTQTLKNLVQGPLCLPCQRLMGRERHSY